MASGLRKGGVKEGARRTGAEGAGGARGVAETRGMRLTGIPCWPESEVCDMFS